MDEFKSDIGELDKVTNNILEGYEDVIADQLKSSEFYKLPENKYALLRKKIGTLDSSIDQLKGTRYVKDNKAIEQELNNTQKELVNFKSDIKKLMYPEPKSDINPNKINQPDDIHTTIAKNEAIYDDAREFMKKLQDDENKLLDDVPELVEQNNHNVNQPEDGHGNKTKNDQTNPETRSHDPESGHISDEPKTTDGGFDIFGDGVSILQVGYDVAKNFSPNIDKQVNFGNWETKVGNAWNSFGEAKQGESKFEEGMFQDVFGKTMTHGFVHFENNIANAVSPIVSDAGNFVNNIFQDAADGWVGGQTFGQIKGNQTQDLKNTENSVESLGDDIANDLTDNLWGFIKKNL